MAASLYTPHGVEKNKVLQNQWCVLYSGKNSFTPCIEVYDKGSNPGHKKCIELDGCRWSKPETIEPAFCIGIKSKQYTFITQSQEELRTWVSYLKFLTPELSDKSTASNMAASNDMDMQDNVLYSSTEQINTFEVIADHNRGNCSSVNLSGFYNLLLDSHCISLAERGSNKKVAYWDYFCIRSYGHAPNSVTFNIGKSGSTGEGNFSFLTTEGKKIIKIVQQQTIKIRNKGSQNGSNTQVPERKAGVSPKTAAKPPIFPKTKLPSTTSPTSANSESSTTSDLKISNQKSVKKKPAPLAPVSFATKSPDPSTRKSSIGHKPEFFEELSQSLATPSSPSSSMLDNEKSISSTASLESVSSVTSKKDKKKTQKELKKERKKQEKIEKERREKELKAQKKQMKLDKKKGKGKNPQLPSPPPSQVEEDHTYAEANDDFIHSCDYAYSDVNVQSFRKSTDIAAEGQYADPWKDDLPPAPAVGVAYPPDDEETVYASPVRHGHSKRDIVTEDYEDVQASVPPEIPHREGVNDNPSNSDIYDHFSQLTTTMDNSENPYGIDSASAPFVPKKNPILPKNGNCIKHEKSETDIYETY